MSALADCNINTLSTAAKCYDCFSKTERRDLKVAFMAIALRAAGGADLTNNNTRNSTVSCLACEPDFRLDSMEVAIWASLAQVLGGTIPSTIAGQRALVTCTRQGPQKLTRAAYTYLLCALSKLGV